MAQASPGLVRVHALGRGAHRTYHTTQLCHHRKVTPRSRRVNPACASSSSDGSDATAESETSFVERDTRAWLDTMVIGMNLCPFARAAMPGTKIIVLGSHVTDMPSLHSVIEAELAILADAPHDPPVTTLVVLPPTVVAALDATTHGGFMEGAVRVAEDATRHLTAQRDTEKDRDGDLIDVVPFHPHAIFGGDVDEEDESQSNGYICTYLDVDEEGAEEGAEGASTAVSTPPSTEELRRMIEAHEGFTGGADRRADWAAANSPVVDEKSNDKALEGEGPTDPADYTGRSPHPILHLLRRCDVDAADESWFGEKGPGTDIRAANAASLRAKGEADLAKMLRRCLTAHHPRGV